MTARTRQVGDAAGGFDTLLGGRHFYQPPYACPRARPADCISSRMTLVAPPSCDVLRCARRRDRSTSTPDFPTDRVLRRPLRTAAPRQPRAGFWLQHRPHPEGSHDTAGVCRSRTQSAGRRRRARTWHRNRDRRTIAIRDRVHAILLTDVFEHLVEPMPLLKMLASRLSPGGWLARHRQCRRDRAAPTSPSSGISGCRDT